LAADCSSGCCSFCPCAVVTITDNAAIEYNTASNVRWPPRVHGQNAGP
jgi:hypothetical protein